jgi:hypothetical protein
MNRTTSSETPSLGRAVAIAIALGIAAVVAHSGAFYTTGRQYYEACFERHLNYKGVEAPKPKDADQGALWASCDPITERVLAATGFPIIYEEKGLYLGGCPNSYTERPLAGWWILVVKRMAEEGGPMFFDRFIPAKWTVDRVIRGMWPNCRPGGQKTVP